MSGASHSGQRSFASSSTVAPHFGLADDGLELPQRSGPGVCLERKTGAA